MANRDHMLRWRMLPALVLAAVLAGCGGNKPPFGKSSPLQSALSPPADGYRYASDLVTGAPDSASVKEADGDENLKTASIAAKSTTRGVDVAPVVGAGKAGNKELRDAMLRALLQRGVRLSQKPVPAHVTVKARVLLGGVRSGQQAAAIDWQVIDASGKVVGTVAQNNRIPATNKDQGWGASADSAAQSAADAVSSLIDAAR